MAKGGQSKDVQATHLPSRNASHIAHIGRSQSKEKGFSWPANGVGQCTCEPPRVAPGNPRPRNSLRGPAMKVKMRLTRAATKRLLKLASASQPCHVVETHIAHQERSTLAPPAAELALIKNYFMCPLTHIHKVIGKLPLRIRGEHDKPRNFKLISGYRDAQGHPAHVLLKGVAFSDALSPPTRGSTFNRTRKGKDYPQHHTSTNVTPQRFQVANRGWASRTPWREGPASPPQVIPRPQQIAI